ncbi:MAG: phage holin family protein [Actinomycetales bacterium]
MANLDKATGTAPVTVDIRDERTIGQLVADINSDITGLVRAEIALAKAELREDAKRGGIGAGLLAGAGVLGLVGFVLLCITAGFALAAAGLSYWAAFGIVTLVLFVLAGILALVGKGRLSNIAGPQQAIDTTKQSIEQVKAAAKHEE